HPTLASSGGPDNSKASSKPSRTARSTSSQESFSMTSQVALDQPARDQVPPVGQHEQQQLEGQRDRRGAEHLHPQRDQQVRDHEIEHQERQEQQEPDLE